MKRKVALLLSLVFLVALLIPVQIFAAGDVGLENAIKIAKEKFTIPDNSKFSFDVYSNNDKKVWNMYWGSKDGIGTSISVSIDENGTVIGYSKNSPKDYSKKKLPKVSKQEALKISDAFIKKINPNAFASVKLSEDNSAPSINFDYYFNYYRTINKIPYYNNNISVAISCDTGEVESYYYNWTDGLVIPSNGKILDKSQAEAAYIEKMGLDLTYKYTLENEKIKTYAAYTPKYNNGSFAIDAITGEKIQTGYVYREYSTYAMKNEKNAAMDMGAGTRLTPEEENAVEAASKIISLEQAESIVKNTSALKLTLDYKLSDSYLSRGWMLSNQYIWRLYYSSASTDSSNSRYLSVGIDAITGDIIDFYINIPYNESDKPSYNYDTAKAAVEKFLQEIQPEKMKNVEFDEGSGSNKDSTEVPRNYSFSYVRKVNGVLFPDNRIRASFDSVTGEITDFSMTWFDASFPAVDKVQTKENIYKKMFSDVGMELVYRVEVPVDSKGNILPTETNAKPVLKAVYALKETKPLTFDANTGTILDYDGKPYREVKAPIYTDIKGNSAEKQITILAENGISLDGTKFRPNEAITQLDFMTLLSKSLGGYYGPFITSKSSTADIDSLYSYLANQGIIKAGEKAPKATIQKQDAVKFIIRALKYDKVGDIKGIFVNSFKDINKANKDLVGYIAIAKGLKIIDGVNGYFRPTDKLTRAQAAVMIYNYLQI